MKCDHCDREATVHEVTMRNGVRIEKHLCDECAAQRGISVQPNAPINELLKQFMTQGLTPGIQVVPQSRQSACPTCRLSFAEFKQQGLLGCPDCYKAFEGQLMPLLERAQEGGQEHTGKRPKRLSMATNVSPPVAPVATPQVGASPVGKAAPAPAPAQSAAAVKAEREKLLGAMRKALETAVLQEKYEAAAKLRDQIKKIEEAPITTRVRATKATPTPLPPAAAPDSPKEPPPA